MDRPRSRTFAELAEHGSRRLVPALGLEQPFEDSPQLLVDAAEITQMRSQAGAREIGRMHMRERVRERGPPDRGDPSARRRLRTRARARCSQRCQRSSDRRRRREQRRRAPSRSRRGSAFVRPDDHVAGFDVAVNPRGAHARPRGSSTKITAERQLAGPPEPMRYGLSALARGCPHRRPRAPLRVGFPGSTLTITPASTPALRAA